MDADVLQRRALLVAGIGEGQAVQVDLSAEALGAPGLRPVHDVGLLAHDGVDPLEAGHALGDEGDALPGGHHGPYQHSDVQVKRLELPQGDLPRDGQIPAVQQSQQAADADDHVQQGHIKGLGPGHVHVLVLVEAVDLGEGRQLLPLLDEGFDDPDAADGLLDLVRQVGKGPLFGEEFPVHDLAVEIIPIHNQQQGDHRHQGQAHVHIKNHLPQHHDQHHRGVKGRDDGGAHQHPHGLQVVGEMGHEVAGLVLVEIAQGQCLQMGEHLPLHVLLNGQGCAEEEIPPPQATQGHSSAQQDDQAHQPPYAVHVDGAGLQPVGDLAGKLGDVHVHQIHQGQRGNPQHILQPVSPDVSANQFQLLHYSPPSSSSGGRRVLEPVSIR